MKIAFVNTWAGGAVYNVTKPIAEELKNRGHEVDYFTADSIKFIGNEFDDTFSDYDVVHVTYFPNALMYHDACEPPMTVGVHHIPAHKISEYARTLRIICPARAVVSTGFSATQLGQVGIYNTLIIPYAFDQSQFTTMEYPEEFTIGILGGDYESKRWQIVRQACKIAKVPLKEFIRESTNDDSAGFQPQASIVDFYKSVSCYVCASFDEGGPLPPQEAMLCGRPVITTRVGMMPSIVTGGINGEFFNGTQSDLVKKIEMLKEGYSWYSMHARTTTIPTVNVVADYWEDMFEGVVEGA